MSEFADKNVIVSGAGEGIGLGLARAFAAAGARVALNDIRPELAQQQAQAINDAVGAVRVWPYPGDVADAAFVQQMVADFAQRVGPPDVAIANAGITRYIPFLEATPERFDRIVAVNLRGSYFLAQAAAKRMLPARRAGRILLLSSVTGIQAYPNFSIYGMTKAALQMLARTIALELGAFAITVNAITPGATLTPRVERDDPNYAANWATVNPTGRVGQIDDIVAAALFLASDAAAQITGQSLVIDGGWTIRSPLPADAPFLPADRDATDTQNSN